MSALITGKRTTTAAPIGAFKKINGSMVVWFVLVGYLVLAKFILSLMPGLNVRVIASEFSWSTILVLGGLGLVGIWLSERTGFPQALDERVSNRQRLLIPILIGLGFGTLEVVIDLLTHGTRFIETQSGDASFNVYFPASLLVYTAGAVMVEAFYRLLPVPLFLFVISNVLLRRRGQEKLFWILAILFALFEPIALSAGLLLSNPSNNAFSTWLVVGAPVFVLTYFLNLTQLVMFRRYGYLASFALRVAEYAVWHILYGSLLYPAFFH